MKRADEMAREPTEMELRVAKALLDFVQSRDYNAERAAHGITAYYLDQARAAIRAMREPTVAMADAGGENIWPFEEQAVIVWQAMIDAASPEGA